MDHLLSNIVHVVNQVANAVEKGDAQIGKFRDPHEVSPQVVGVAKSLGISLNDLRHSIIHSKKPKAERLRRLLHH